jgi:hypothetical protein
MKNLTTLIIIFLFAFTFQAKAQTDNTDNTNTYKYAILRVTRSMGSFSLDVFLDNNQQKDLYKSLNLDTLKLPEYNEDYTYILKGLNYMDKQGYELVSSSMGTAQYRPMLREFIFRKKNPAK